MKKLLRYFFYALVVCLAYSGWSRYRQQKKAYFKNETSIKHLKQDIFFLKLAQAMPSWMEEQIQENFQDFENGIAKGQVDATFAHIRNVFPSQYIVRYRVLNNELYRYFPEGELISLEDNSTELAIKTLIQLVSLPDLDCIVSFYDGIRPNHTFFHSPSKELQAPLLISAKVKNTPYIVLIPDWRSLGEWWASDIKHIKSKVEAFPWENKKEFAVWRGSANREERTLLCRISLAHPEYLDAKFSLLLDHTELEKEGMLGGNIDWEEFLDCKYLPYVDGYMTASPALQWRLLSNSVTFKPETNEVQWFHRALRPYEHYVPVKANLSDLIEKFDWAKSHDAECKQIAEKSTEFALNNLMYEDVLLYFNAVLNTYASLQKCDSSEMKREIASDPHWVNIQHRKTLRKKAKCNQSAYWEHASPGGGIISFSETSTIP